MLQICEYISRETFSVSCVLVISLHRVKHLWHDILHGGWWSHQSSPSLYFWHFSLSLFIFLCLMSAVFTTAVSILLKSGDKYFSTSMLNPWWYLEQGDVVKVFIGLWTSTTTLFFLNMYEEQLIRSIYHPGALAYCSCAHWLGLPPGSPSPQYSRCFITIFPHHPQYNYELHLLLGTKQSLKLEFSVTHGFVLAECKL